MYTDVLPFDNLFVMKRLRGPTIIEALENAACDIVAVLPSLRPITFTVDPHRPAGSSIYVVYLAPWVGHTHHHGLHALAAAAAAPAPKVTVALSEEGEYVYGRHGRVYSGGF